MTVRKCEKINPSSQGLNNTMRYGSSLDKTYYCRKLLQFAIQTHEDIYDGKFIGSHFIAIGRIQSQVTEGLSTLKHQMYGLLKRKIRLQS